MTPESALEILGLNAPVDAAAVRSSYLKLLRVTKPDQMPEQFRLLREAYELLQSGMEQPSAWAQLGPDDDDLEDELESPSDEWRDPKGADDSEEPDPDPGQDQAELLLRYIDQELTAGPERIRALDRAIPAHPGDKRFLTRLFDELVELNMTDLAREVLDDLRPIDPLLSWQLLVQKVGTQSTITLLRNTPEGATPDDRLKAIRLLIEWHRQVSVGAQLALLLAKELDGPTRKRLASDLRTLAMEIGATGFVEEGQALLREVLEHLPEDERPVLAEWAGLTSPDRIIVASIAAAIQHEDASFVAEARERIANPEGQVSLLAAQAPGLLRRYGDLLRAGRARPKSGNLTRSDDVWPIAIASVLVLMFWLIHHNCAK